MKIWLPLALSSGLLAMGCAGHSQAAPAKTANAPAATEGLYRRAAAPGAERPAPTNPVQVEMQLLEATLANGIRGFADGDLRPIAAALAEVHAAKEQTEAALQAGSYLPPKNPKAVATFVAMDEAFHEQLVDLVRAAKANDPAKAAPAYARILQSCEGCHVLFRE